MQPLKIAFPLGIGDCHWVLLKMRALSRFFDQRPIHAHINEGPRHATVGFLEMCPQIEKAVLDHKAPYGYDFKPALDFLGRTNPVDAGPRAYKHWARLENCLDFQGYDVWGVLNACIDAGMEMDEIWPELNPYGGTEYEYALNIPDEAREFAKGFGDRPILFYPSGKEANRLFHSNWWTLVDWTETALKLNAEFKKPIVVIGSSSKSDVEYWKQLKPLFDSQKVSYIDTVGKTDIPQYCALIEACSVWVGLNSGGGIVSAGMKVPTVMLWCDSAYPIPGSNAKRMNTNMQQSWLNTEQRRFYRTLSFGSPRLTPDNIIKKVIEVAR